jgi:serine/threonine protein phosphatase PrpC
MVEGSALYEVLMSSKTPEKACNAMISTANEAGGTDNITAVVVFC